MTLKEIEQLVSTNFIGQYLTYKDKEIHAQILLENLLAVAKAAKHLRLNTDECGDSSFEDRWALTEALRDLESGE